MTAHLARHFLQYLPLAAAMVLALCSRMPAQSVQEVPVVQPGDDPDYAVAPQDNGRSYAPLSPQQLDELVGPVALYPDPLLAQVLAAATYPMDIVQAARFLSTSSDLEQLDQMGLDPSVQALARFPDLLKRMDGELDWTEALGAAFLNQQQDVMDAVQRLRAQAMASGALQDTPEQEVYLEEDFVGIVPADPEIIYVPQYVPEVVYGWVEPPFGGYYSSISFGFGCHTGSWLHLGFNWGRRCLAYRPWHFDHHHGFHRGGFGRAYYGHADWGRTWHRRSGSAMPRFRGGPDGFRGGRGLSAMRSGFGRRSGDGTRDGFAAGAGGSRRDFGDGSRRGPGEGFRNGPRRGQGRGDSDSGFGGGRRGGEGGGPLGGFSNGLRPSELNGGATGGRRDGSRAGQSRGLPGAIGNDTGNRGEFRGLGRSPRDESPQGALGGGRSTSDGARSGITRGGSGAQGLRNGGSNGYRSDSPLSSGNSPRRSFERPGGWSGSPRGLGGGSSSSGWTLPRGSQQRGYSGSGFTPRSFDGGQTRGVRQGASSTGGMRGLSRGDRSGGGSSFRGGAIGGSGPRIQSRSSGMSRSPGSGSPRGMRSSGMGGGSRSSGMRSGGSRGGGARSSGMRSGGSRGGGGRRGR